MSQWYISDNLLCIAEEQAMRKFYPNAVQGYLSDGRMCWTNTFTKIISPFSRTGYEDFTVMMVYNKDHPNLTDEAHTGSVKMYMISPRIEEMHRRFTQCRQSSCPHIMNDNFGNQYICLTINYDLRKKADHITSGAQYMGQMANWLNAAQGSLVSDRIYNNLLRGWGGH